MFFLSTSFSDGEEEGAGRGEEEGEGGRGDATCACVCVHIICSVDCCMQIKASIRFIGSVMFSGFAGMV